MTAIDTSYTAALDYLDTLIPKLGTLRDCSPLVRAELARGLSGTMRAALGRVGDEAISEAVYAPSRDNPNRITGQTSVAIRLGIKQSTVNSATQNYRAWLDEQR